ncbi:MAG: hypothetical protein LR015_11340 [Verrucomicrobia bacterium]|nr:hypothetical protein [Verrucomicrobiota bacterium]
MVLEDGSLLVGGDFDEVSVSSRSVEAISLVQLNPTQSGLDQIRVPVQLSASESPAVHHILHHGNFLYVLGTFKTSNSENFPGLFRLFSTNLELDQRFNAELEFVPYQQVRPVFGGQFAYSDHTLLIMGQYRKTASYCPTRYICWTCLHGGLAAIRDLK